MARFLSLLRLIGPLLGPALVLGACAYPKRSTPLRSVGEVSDQLNAPANLWRMTVLEAEVPPERRGGLPWDEGGGKPDPQVRLYRDDSLLWKSEEVDDTLAPTFDQSLPRNVRVGAQQPFRIELWDHDQVGGDPIGVWSGEGLPSNMLPGNNARIALDSGAAIVMRVDPPHAHEGSGIAQYEVHSEALHVLEVHESSPASRAGIREGARIVAIDGKTVAELGEGKAASALSMAGTRRDATLTLEHDGKREQVKLDGGYVWLSM